MSGEPIGIIYPPPELRNIVDKTASFVARNGPEFESRIQQNEQNNPKFNFLKQGDPYNGYYQHKVKDFREGGGTKPNEISAPPSSGAVTNNNNQNQQNQVALKSAKQLEALTEAPIIIREPPPDFEFSSDPPSLSALDLDTVKLTAQFVAIHGRSFLTNLMGREQRNRDFDFLRPQHGLFSYFTQLIEQYTKVLMPPKTLLGDLKKEAESQKAVLEKVRYRLEWTKIQETERKREEEEAERERVQYAQIDWHDFVVVETVDYQPHEQGLFPPPTTPEQVGSRILLQARIEEQGNDTIEMDVDSDDEGPTISKKEDKAKSAMPPPVLPPLPPSLDNVLIRKDYNPKASKSAPATHAQAVPDAWVVSPITGEKVPADKLQEHMRYALLDPRWVEERERTIQDKINQEEVFAPGTSIESSLKHLAERRTDIFGSGDVETAIGQKIGEEERRQKQPEKVSWDGYNSSAEAASRAARANITIEEQIQQIHRMKGLVDDEKSRIGPNSGQHQQQSHQQHQQQQHHHHSMQQRNQGGGMLGHSGGNPNMMHHNAPPPHFGHHQQHHHQSVNHTMLGNPAGAQMMMGAPPGSAFLMATPPVMLHQGMYGLVQQPDMNALPPMSSPLLPGLGGNSGAPAPHLTPAPEEPPAKKQKTEESLVPEEEFLASNPGPVTFQIMVPQGSDKPEWNLNGQALTVTMPLTESINAVKTKIFEQLSFPQGKQKLQYEGMFVKDSNSLAFYNVPNGATIVLALKERGGRKK